MLNKQESLTEEEFKSLCSLNVDNLSKKAAHTFLVCVDGSDQSEIAFLSAMNLRKKFDHICVFHAFKGDHIDSLPTNFKPKIIKEKYEVDLTGSIPSDRFSFIWEDRKGKPVINTLNLAISKQSDQLPGGDPPDFVLMGHHGRKGPKEVATSLGSNSDRALRALPLPCFIIKKMINRGPRSYVMAVDESDLSIRGLDILLRIINPRDSIICVHFYQADDDVTQFSAMKQQYESDLEEFGPINSQFLLIEKERGKSLTRAIVDYVEESECDIFAIAPRARQTLSSLSDYVVNHVSCNVLLCKN